MSELILTEYGLTGYQIAAFKKFTKRKNFAGARVLEIGGHDLPPTLKFDLLGAAKWFSVDVDDHGSGSYQHYQQLTGQDESGIINIGSVDRNFLSRKSGYIIGDITQAPRVLFDCFDIAISICALEHIRNMPLAIKKIFECLSTNGSFMSAHGPIWSSFCGSHFWVNKQFNFNNMHPIDPWDHLILSQPELYLKLINSGINEYVASAAVDSVFTNPVINRLFFEDYIKYMDQSKFAGFSAVSHGSTTVVMPELKDKLLRKYEGYTNFESYGIFINAWKG